MQTQFNTTYPHLVPPSSVPPHAPDCHAPAAGATSPPRGSSSGYSERVVAMLCASVRQYGLSDSAAAVKNGMSASTLSSWKREFPEIALQLAQAREDCRTRHLDVIEKAAQADNARGWRAAAWMLERLFPGDYSPRMKERIAHHHFEERQREREDEALLAEKRQAESDARAARAARAAKADQEYQAALAAYEAQQAAAAAQPPATENHASASESALHNVKYSEAAAGASSPGSGETFPHRL